MTRIKDKQAKKDLKKWLSHFQTFETYIEFFCFEEFLSKEKTINNSSLRPINILTGKNKEPEWRKKGENPKIEIILDLEFNTIADMLKGLNYKILKRSKKWNKLLLASVTKTVKRNRRHKYARRKNNKINYCMRREDIRVCKLFTSIGEYER